KDVRGGIQVSASDGQLAIPMAVDDPETTKALHEIYQGLFFDSEGMSADADTQYASQVLFAGFLIKLAEISAQKPEDLESRLVGIGDPIERIKVRADYLKGALIRALTEAGYSVSPQAFRSNGFGLI